MNTDKNKSLVDFITKTKQDIETLNVRGAVNKYVEERYEIICVNRLQ